MASFLLLGLLFFIFQNYCALIVTGETVKVTNPPKVESSYIAVGEVVEILDGEKVQLKFDETFDANSGNAAFVVYGKGKNITFVEDALANQTFMYDNGECRVITVEEWNNEIPLPSSMGYTDNDGKVRFSLKQLFNIPDKYLASEDAGVKNTFRNLPALLWKYNMETVLEDGEKSVIDIYAYWSDDTWTTTSSSSNGQVPLGFKIIKLIYDKANKKTTDTEEFINVFSFIHKAVNRKALEPRTGMYCKDRISVFELPMLSKAKAISFKSEIILPDEMEIKTMDVYYDMENGLLRVDIDRLDNQQPEFKTRKYTSDITSKKLETTYAIDVFKGEIRCKVTDTQNYAIDIQELIDPKLELSSWNFDTLLRRNSANWTYIGKTTKRNIPCHLFQGIVKDWLNIAPNGESLWEWCVVENISPESEIMNFRDGEIGLISLQIKFNQETPIISTNEVATMIYHFYDVIEEDAANLDVSTFDITKCFQPDDQRRLQFAVDLKIDSSNLENVKNATSDVRFLGAWKKIISEKSNLKLSTLRVAKVQSMVWNSTLLVSFTLLGIHPDLQNHTSQNSPTLEEAIKYLNSSVNNEELQISYSWIKDQAAVTLKALKNSMLDIITKPKEIPTPAPILSSSTTDRTTFTLIPPDTSIHDGGQTTSNTDSGSTHDGGQTTSNTDSGSTHDGGQTTSNTDSGSTHDGGQTTSNLDGTDSPLGRSVSTGHGSGTVAGVSIAMLLIGLTMGVGGTFYKYRGMPKFR